MGIYIWPWVGSLAMFPEDIWYDVVELRHQVEHGVIREVFQSKLSLYHVSGISLPEYSMPVARDNLHSAYNSSAGV